MAAWKPTRKVSGGIVIGAPASVIIAWALREFAGVEMPPEVAAAVGALISIIIAYLVPDK
jgi:putative flippase GtrA